MNTRSTSPSYQPSQPDDTELTALLSQFGFSETEARIYLALASGGDATAYELAKATGIARANAYAAVSVLAGRGAIQQVGEHPARYIITAPDAYFEAEARKTQTASHTLTSAIRARRPAQEDSFVAQLRGKPAVAKAISEMIAEARNTIHIKTVDNLATPFLEELCSRAHEGVEITIVGSGDDWGTLRDCPNTRIIPHEGTGSVPSAPHQVLLTMTVDSARMVIASFNEPERAYIAMDGTVVYVVQTMILHEVYLAEIYRTLGPETLERAGISFQALRQRFRPATLGDKVFE